VMLCAPINSAKRLALAITKVLAISVTARSSLAALLLRQGGWVGGVGGSAGLGSRSGSGGRPRGPRRPRTLRGGSLASLCARSRAQARMVQRSLFLRPPPSPPWVRGLPPRPHGRSRHATPWPHALLSQQPWSAPTSSLLAPWPLRRARRRRRDATTSSVLLPLCRLLTLRCLPCLRAPPLPSQPAHKSLAVKKTLAKKMKQNRPIPQWIRMRTGNRIRCALATGHAALPASMEEAA
jgi:large subunit ribosomal protein L39e